MVILSTWLKLLVTLKILPTLAIRLSCYYLSCDNDLLGDSIKLGKSRYNIQNLLCITG